MSENLDEGSSDLCINIDGLTPNPDMEEDIKLGEEHEYDYYIDQIKYSSNHKFVVIHSRQHFITILKVEKEVLHCKKVYPYNDQNDDIIYIDEVSNNGDVIIKNKSNENCSK